MQYTNYTINTYTYAILSPYGLRNGPWDFLFVARGSQSQTLGKRSFSLVDQKGDQQTKMTGEVCNQYA